MLPDVPSARCASTPAGMGLSMCVHEPAPTSGLSRRVRIMRSNQASSESGSPRWAATLTVSYPYRPSDTTGRTSSGASEKPPPSPDDHCIGVRIACRPGSDRSSPMPISSP